MSFARTDGTKHLHKYTTDVRKKFIGFVFNKKKWGAGRITCGDCNLQKNNLHQGGVSHRSAFPPPVERIRFSSGGAIFTASSRTASPETEPQRAVSGTQGFPFSLFGYNSKNKLLCAAPLPVRAVKGEHRRLRPGLVSAREARLSRAITLCDMHDPREPV